MCTLLVLIQSSCSIQEVKDYHPDELILASDFLDASDSLIFRDYEKSSGIRVRIVHLSSDSIIRHFEQYGYNSQFDGVFLNSSYTLNRLSKKEILHPLSDKIKEQPVAIRSPKNDWIVLSYDPYILQQADSGTVIQTYNELTYGARWARILTSDEQAAFEASVLHQFGRSGRAKSFTWLQSMNEQMNTSNPDSSGIAGFALNRFSKIDLATKRYTIPNQVRGGAFYDGLGIAALRHSSNYTVINELIEFYLNPHYNQKLAGRMQAFPIESPKGRSDFSWQNEYPIFFRCSPNQCVRQYRDLERVRMKLASRQDADSTIEI